MVFDPCPEDPLVIVGSDFFLTVELVSLANKLGNMLFNALKYSFPNKYFYVYITIALHGSFIVRFHQKWENEIPYYNVKDFDESKEIILVFEG